VFLSIHNNLLFKPTDDRAQPQYISRFSDAVKNAIFPEEISKQRIEMSIKKDIHYVSYAFEELIISHGLQNSARRVPRGLQNVMVAGFVVLYKTLPTDRCFDTFVQLL